MADLKEQSYANHTKYDPAFHFFLVPILAFNVIGHIITLYRAPSIYTIWSLVVSFALLVLLFKVRLYSLKVQDRVIRLEERLRLAEHLPRPMHSSIGQLSESQLIALRFASDAELSTLVAKTVAGKLKPKEIKQSIAEWRPDYFRV